MLISTQSETSAEMLFLTIILFGICYHDPSDIVRRNPTVQVQPNVQRLAGLRYNVMAANTANARYLRSDFNQMIRKITIIQILIDAQLPGIAEIFEEYKEALIAIMTETNVVRYC